MQPLLPQSPKDFGRDLGDDRVAGGAQARNSGGYPMSQKTNSGFRYPPAGEGLTCRPSIAFSGALPMLEASLWSRVVGVAQTA